MKVIRLPDAEPPKDRQHNSRFTFHEVNGGPVWAEIARLRRKRRLKKAGRG